MDSDASKREGMAGKSKADELRSFMQQSHAEVNKATSMQLISSLKVSNSSPLVSPSTTINMPRELYSIDVAATFGVPLTTVGDLHKLINDIDAGKHDELLSGKTNHDRMETMDALGTICISIHADSNNADVIPCKVSHADDSINLNVDESTIPSDCWNMVVGSALYTLEMREPIGGTHVNTRRIRLTLHVTFKCKPRDLIRQKLNPKGWQYLAGPYGF
ncbi:hypothetical protein Tco_1313278 [Tanacetum coccineum]